MNNQQIIPTVGGKHRSNYLRLLNAIPAVGADPGAWNVGRSQLRLEVPLTNNSGSYKFELFPTTVNARKSEKRLNRNDLFVATGIALGVTKWNPVTDTYGNNPLYFNPDANFFLGVASSVKEADCLNALYNAQMSLRSSTTERVAPFLTNELRRSPNRGYTKGVASSHILYDDHQEFDGIPFFDFEPHVILSGQDDNYIHLELPKSDLTVLQGGVNQSGTAVDTRNVAVIILDGFVVPEGASVPTRFDTY